MAAAALAASSPATAQVQTVTYSFELATTLSVAPEYAVLVELSHDERIDNVVVGDSGAWQVTPTKRGDRLVVKPLSASVTTDLVVTTTARRYMFLLKPTDSPGGSPFVLRFEYPDLTPVPVVQPATISRYRFRGDAALFPSEMSDDGARTTIVWKPDRPLLAVYAVDAKGREALVNGRMVGQGYVVEGVAQRYMFRRDKAKATASRDASPKSR